MATNKIRIPFELDLVKEKGWLVESKTLFYTSRLHFFIEEYQAEDTTYPGEILATFHPTDKAKTLDALELRYSLTNIDETIKSQILSEEFVAQVESEIRGKGMINPFYKLDSSVTASLKSKISESLNFTTKDSTSVTNQIFQRYEVTQTIKNYGKETFHAVACYRRLRCDVHLRYIDYLFADYHTTFFGLRKKKTNFPRPTEDGKHINIILMNQPVFSIWYWDPLPKSSLIYTNTDYGRLKNKVQKPWQISIKRDVEPLNLHLPKSLERPTLYTLSNIAFPYKWIDRKGEWTVEELKKMELDEAVGSGWWIKHRPHTSDRNI